MSLDTLSLTLSALSAFFTLITGAFAIFIVFAISYFTKLKSDRENEIKKLAQLEDDLMNKIKEAEGLKNSSKTELETIKQGYFDLRNRFFHLTSPNAFSVVDGRYSSGPTVTQLTDQINSLLSMIASLQAQITESEKK